MLWLGVPLVAALSSSCHPSKKAAPPKESQVDQIRGLFDHSQTVLTSRKKYGEVRIPFTLRDNKIYLKMIWAGRPTEAILDTGSAFIAWPQSLHLTSTATGVPQESLMAAGIVKRGEWRVIPSIKVGDCEWKDMPTVADGEMKRSGPSKTVAPPDPLLGAPAFHGVVLTIDYQKKVIIMRGVAYDITHLPHHPHDLLLTPGWIQGYLPVLRGVLANRPARFALDTGCDGVAISTRFARQLPRSSFGAGTTANINGARVPSQCLTKTAGTVAGVHFRAYGARVLDVPGDYDALVATNLPGISRVTIDYTRHKVLLEPSSGGPR